MKIFIYEDLPKITTNWHAGGSLAIVAEEQPTEWAIDAEDWTDADDERLGTVALPEPTAVYPIEGGAEPRTFVFPDAGCC